MKLKVYYLSTCSTCNRIMKELEIDSANAELREIKSAPITEAELIHLRSYNSSYVELFNKRAMKYKALNKKVEEMEEEQIKSLILEECTFLKRPIFEFDDAVFAGNSKKIVEAVKIKLNL